MGDALLDLEHVLRSRKDKLTIQESNLLLTWRARVMRDFTVGFGSGAIVTWLAAKRFSTPFRLSLTAGAAFTCGMVNFGRSIESCADRVLSLEGSRIQTELAAIMLKKYGSDPKILKRVSKILYREEVFVDTSVDKPIFRWRLRNTYGDPTNHSQNASFGEETDSMKNDVKKSTVSNVEHNQVNASKSATTPEVNAASVMDMVADPFHIMFHSPVSVENIPENNVPSTSSQREIYRERRRRRHRRHHQEDADV